MSASTFLKWFSSGMLLMAIVLLVGCGGISSYEPGPVGAQYTPEPATIEVQHLFYLDGAPTEIYIIVHVEDEMAEVCFRYKEVMEVCAQVDAETLGDLFGDEEEVPPPETEPPVTEEEVVPDG